MSRLLRFASLAPLASVCCFAQCSMCRTAAAAQSPEAASELNTAIVLLFAPAIAMFSGVFLLAFWSQKRDRNRDSEGVECAKRS